ncbi:MAG TPA: ABC transporter substrate-binding protein [Longimicrobiales bacterium]|nr:ABC transporter substrate-binding protein [Longimicrobiales bacterium]
MPTRMLHRTRALMLAVVLMLGAGCDDGVTEPAGEEEIIIGGLFSLTGNWSTLGSTGKAALELAVEDVNAQLDAGDNRLRFVAMVEDTKLDPALALAGAQALHGRGARVLVGPQSSAEVGALRTWADASGAIVISPSSTAGTLAIPNDNILRLTPSDSLEGSALVALIRSEGKSHIVPMWRDDSGNDGLAIATRTQFSAAGGTVSAGVEYGANVQDFAASVAALRTQVVAAIAAAGAQNVAVAHAGFDEVVDIFVLAAADPVLSSVKWYGTDGTALSEPLRASAAAAAFAVQVGFSAPIFGLDPGAATRWQPVADRIAARAGLQPDAFALAVYDAVWIAASAYLVLGRNEQEDVAGLRSQVVESAAGFYGTTGWTRLNAAGDRQFGNFDFFGIRPGVSPAAWMLTARYDTRTRVLSPGAQ